MGATTPWNAPRTSRQTMSRYCCVRGVTSPAYERALRDAAIPHTVVKGHGFFETPEIETLVNLLRVLVDPTDDRALYGLLRSPMFGCTDDALAQLALTVEDSDDLDRLWDALCAADAE